MSESAIPVRLAAPYLPHESPDVPKSLIARLAADPDGALGESVMEYASQFAPEHLLSLLGANAAPEPAAAIAHRPQVSEPATDAASTAEAETVEALLGSGSTAIREATLDSLAAPCGPYCAWPDKGGPRVALPRGTGRVRAPSDMVATHLLQVLTARTEFGADLAAQLRDKLALQLRADGAAEDTPERLTPDEANAKARLMQACGKLNEETLLQAAHRGEARLVSALLALAADMPFAAVDRAASLRSAKGLVSLCWKASIGCRKGGGP